MILNGMKHQGILTLKFIVQEFFKIVNSYQDLDILNVS